MINYMHMPNGRTVIVRSGSSGLGAITPPILPPIEIGPVTPEMAGKLPPLRPAEEIARILGGQRPDEPSGFDYKWLLIAAGAAVGLMIITSRRR